jgi:hypothetical protein
MPDRAIGSGTAARQRDRGRRPGSSCSRVRVQSGPAMDRPGLPRHQIKPHGSKLDQQGFAHKIPGHTVTSLHQRL